MPAEKSKKYLCLLLHCNKIPIPLTHQTHNTMATEILTQSQFDAERAVAAKRSAEAEVFAQWLREYALPVLASVGYELAPNDDIFKPGGIVAWLPSGSAYMYVRRPEWPSYADSVKIRVSCHDTGDRRMSEEIQLNGCDLDKAALQLDFYFRPELVATERQIAAKGSHPVARMSELEGADIELGSVWVSRKGVEMQDFTRFKSVRVMRYA